MKKFFQAFIQLKLLDYKPLDNKWSMKAHEGLFLLIGQNMIFQDIFILSLSFLTPAFHILDCSTIMHQTQKRKQDSKSKTTKSIPKWNPPPPSLQTHAVHVRYGDTLPESNLGSVTGFPVGPAVDGIVEGVVVEVVVVFTARKEKIHSLDWHADYIEAYWVGHTVRIQSLLGIVHFYYRYFSPPQTLSKIICLIHICTSKPLFGIPDIV